VKPATAPGLPRELHDIPGRDLARQDAVVLLHTHSDVDCGVIEIECLGGGEEHHNFIEDFPLESQEFMDTGYHGECKVCVQGGQTVDPEVCHPVCIPPDDEDAQLAYGQMLQRARAGDVRGVAEAALEVPQYARLNEDRQSLQVVDCSGGIVASLPLGELRSEVHAMLRSALEQ
jgi:hypothetical protein